MASFLVNGGAGFIGSALVRRLVEQGERVRVVDDFSTGFKRNLDNVLNQVELIEGDLADLSIANEAVKGVQYILHEAAIPSVPRSVEDPIGNHKANVNATLNVLAAARSAGVKRFVYASSCSIYGNPESLPIAETAPQDPLSPYALSKVVGEKYCDLFCRVYGLPTVALRYFNVFGPRQDPRSQYSSVVSRFVDCAVKGERPIIYGDGEQSRDFIYVEDVVEANLLACTAEGAIGKVFNIGSGKCCTINQLLGEIRSVVGHELKPKHEASRLGDVRLSWADIGRAQELLGFEPNVNFGEGLKRTVKWFEEAGQATQ